jgi:hypothetical protein
MKKVTINGVSYIGELKEDKETGKMVLSGAMAVAPGSVSKDDIARYIQMENLGELDDIEFGGQGVAFSVSPFSEEEQMFVDMAGIIMKTAKGKALKQVENNLFGEILGK